MEQDRNEFAMQIAIRSYLELRNGEKALEIAKAMAAQFASENSYYWLGYVLSHPVVQHYNDALDVFKHRYKITNGTGEHVGLTETALRLLDWDLGWELYTLHAVARNSGGASCSSPLWTGESLAGKALLVSCDQHYGDKIQFARLLPLIPCASVKLAVNEPLDSGRECQLLSLFENSFPKIDVVNWPHDQKEDYHILLSSLPFRLKVTPSSLGRTRYLHTSAELEKKWKEAIAASTTSPGLKIGIMWRGKPKHKKGGNDKRAAGLQPFEPLFNIPNVSVYSLQIEKFPKEVAAFKHGDKIIDLTLDMITFEHTAAAIEALDVIVTVDSSVAHLAGALGKTVCVMLHRGADWRWETDGSESIWYSSARLFRQDRTEQWEETFQQCADYICSTFNIFRDQTVT
jgi:hypothetical protein